MVGSANGMSMTTSRIRLPEKWSRTSTQAIVVPITMLTSVTSRAWPTVSRSAAAVCSLVSAAQYADQPPLEAWTRTASQRDQHQQAEPEQRDAQPEPGGRRQRRSRGGAASAHGGSEAARRRAVRSVA